MKTYLATKIEKGKDIVMSQFKGKVLFITNVATF
jgi:glutathione peroxidase-family protein